MRLLGARQLMASKFCPKYWGYKSGYRHDAFIGLGGNIGDVAKRFDRLIGLLLRDKRVHVTQSSPILKNAAFGYTAQADFLNAVIELQTSLNGFELLKFLQRLEIKFGRKRSFKNAPRTLDLDILYFSEKIRPNNRLLSPHPGVNERLSTLIPLGLLRRV